MTADQIIMDEKITVVIPAYNAAHFLLSCLDSVFRQTCPPAEILVVDDCSTDQTREILQQYPVTALCLPRRMGAAYARVVGARAATGDVIAFLDADCVAGPDWLSKLVRALTEDVAGVGGGYRFDEGNSLWASFIARLARDWFAAEQPDGRAILIGGNAAFRKEAFLGRKYFRELSCRRHYASGDDTLLCLEMLETRRLNYLPHVLVTHQPYGITGFFRRQIRWAKSRVLLFFDRPVKQKAGLASGPMPKVLLQIAISALLAASGTFSFFSPWSLSGLPLLILSLFLFFVVHRQSLFVLTARRKFSRKWIPAAVFLWLRNLCFIFGIGAAFIQTLSEVAAGLFDRLVFAYHFFHPRRLFKVYLFVTSRCNRRCSFCFYKKNLSGQGAQDALKTDDFEKISGNLPFISYLTLTGGEPFLRKDLDQIALQFYQKNRTRFMVIPTNGTLPEATENIVERLLIDAPRLRLTVQVSLNGLEEHFLAGAECPDANLFVDTWERLGRLQKRFSKLRRHLSLVITGDNCEYLDRLAQIIPARLQPDHFFITPQRTGPGEVSLPHISLGHFVQLLRKQQASGPTTLFDRIFRKIYKKVEQAFIRVYRTKKMPWPCLAGRKFIVIAPDGGIQICEPREEKIANALENKWRDVKQIRRYKMAIDKIRDKKCACTWGCAVVSNAIHRPSVWLSGR